MQRHKCTLGMLAALVFTLGVCPTEAHAAQAPRTVKNPAAGEGRSQIAAAIIRDLYARLAKYSRGTEGELRFKLDGFRTLSGERARQARLLDLFSAPEGRLVDVHIEHSANGDDVRAGYHARWSSEEAPPLKYTDGYAHRDATLEDLIQEASAEMPDLAEISAVTTYRVKVHLAGQSRTYRAAVFWTQLPEQLFAAQAADARYMIQDQITVGLADVAQETALALTDPPRRPAHAVVPEVDMGDLRKTPVCEVTSQSKALETVTSSSGDAYRPSFSGQINCSCDSSCISGCAPVNIQASCGHAKCRKTTTDLQTTTAFTYAFGAAKGGECAVGWGCAGLKCTNWFFFCSCGNLSVKVSISTKIGNVTPSLEVGYTFSPSTQYTRKVNAVVVCPPCFAAGGPDPGIQPALYPGTGGTIVQDTACGDNICDSELGESLSTCSIDCDCNAICSRIRNDCLAAQCPTQFYCDECEQEYQSCMSSCQQ